MMSPLPGLRRDQIDHDDRSIWRYRAALPFEADQPVTLGEGRTPLIEARFRGIPCRFKLEWFSPTGSFKDRGASVLITFLRHQGVTAIVEDSSGNGGAALAGYGAAAGMAVTITVPESTPPAKVAQAAAYGAEVLPIPGDRQATEDAAITLATAADGKTGRFYAGHNWHPMFLQGTKTLGYEIWEDLGFAVPDNIVIPGSAGSNLLGCHLAFTELLANGEIDRLPRLFMTQPVNCAPIHHSFQAGADSLEDVGFEIDFAPTIADGTAIRRPVRAIEMLAALRACDGGTAAVTEDEIAATSFELASQGLYVEPTCAHAAAGMAQLIERGVIGAEDETVVVLTGTGLKSTGFYADRADPR